MDYLAHFERNPELCGGQWVIKGTRVPVRMVLASLAEGAVIEDILADFPTVGRFDTFALGKWTINKTMRNLFNTMYRACVYTVDC